jgi:hypothetical protein
MNKLDGARPFVTLLGIIMLFIHLSVHAQGEGTQITPEQVNQAVRKTQKLCENQIEQGAVPGLATASIRHIGPKTSVKPYLALGHPQSGASVRDRSDTFQTG